MGKAIASSRRVAAWILGTGVQAKFAAIAFALILVSGIVMIAQTRVIVARVVGAQLDQRAVYTAKEVAARSQDAALTNDSFTLYELLRHTVSANQDVRYVFIMSAEGDIIAHSFGKGVPADLIELKHGNPKHSDVIKISTEEGIVRDAVAPIPLGAGSVVRVGVTQKSVDESVASSSRKLSMSVASTAAAALLLSYVITLLLVRPLLDLRRAAKDLGTGNFAVRARVWWSDEIGELAIAFNDMAARLQRLYADIQENDSAKTELLRKIITAQEEERKRIARELHDETSQSLASVNMALATIVDGMDTKRRTEELQTSISQALERIRNLAFELRPGLLDDLGLVAAIDRYAEDFEKRYALSVDFLSVGVNGRRLTPEVETTVYRIVQEALVNSAKHAHASHVSVIIELEKQTLRVMVEDNGHGFDCDNTAADGSGRSLGLFGMCERAALIGGYLRIDSSPGEGTAVALDVPLEAE